MVVVSEFVGCSPSVSGAIRVRAYAPLVPYMYPIHLAPTPNCPSRLAVK